MTTFQADPITEAFRRRLSTQPGRPQSGDTEEAGTGADPVAEAFRSRLAARGATARPALFRSPMPASPDDMGPPSPGFTAAIAAATERPIDGFNFGPDPSGPVQPPRMSPKEQTAALVNHYRQFVPDVTPAEAQAMYGARGRGETDAQAGSGFSEGLGPPGSGGVAVPRMAQNGLRLEEDQALMRLRAGAAANQQAAEQTAARGAGFLGRAEAVERSAIAGALNQAADSFRMLEARGAVPPNAAPTGRDPGGAMLGQTPGDTEALSRIAAQADPVTRNVVGLYGLPFSMGDPLTASAAMATGGAGGALLESSAGRALLDGIARKTSPIVAKAASSIIGSAAGMGAFTAADAGLHYPHWDTDPDAGLALMRDGALQGVATGAMFGAAHVAVDGAVRAPGAIVDAAGRAVGRVTDRIAAAREADAQAFRDAGRTITEEMQTSPHTAPPPERAIFSTRPSVLPDFSPPGQIALAREQAAKDAADAKAGQAASLDEEGQRIAALRQRYQEAQDRRQSQAGDKGRARPDLGSSRLNIPQAALTHEQAAQLGYSYSLGTGRVSRDEALSFAGEMSQADPGTHYAAVEAPDGWLVASRPGKAPKMPAAASSPTRDALDAATWPEVQQLAEQHGIDPAKRNRRELVALIRARMAATDEAPPAPSPVSQAEPDPVAEAFRERLARPTEPSVASPQARLSPAVESPAPAASPGNVGSPEAPIDLPSGRVGYKQDGSWIVRNPDAADPFASSYRRVTDPAAARELDQHAATQPPPEAAGESGTEPIPGVEQAPLERPVGEAARVDRLSATVEANPENAAALSTLRNLQGKAAARFKAKHPDAILLMRVGDSYEVFDAEDRRKIRDTIGATAIPADGLDIALKHLISAGHRVAITEQVRPEGAPAGGASPAKAAPEPAQPAGAPQGKRGREGPPAPKTSQPAAPVGAGRSDPSVPLSELHAPKADEAAARKLSGEVAQLKRKQNVANNDAVELRAKVQDIRRQVEADPAIITAQKEAARAVQGGAGVNGRREVAKRMVVDEALRKRPDYQSNIGSLERINDQISDLDAKIEEAEQRRDQAARPAIDAEEYRAALQPRPMWELDAELRRQEREHQERTAALNEGRTNWRVPLSEAPPDPRTEVLREVLDEKRRASVESRPATTRTPIDPTTKEPTGPEQPVEYKPGSEVRPKNIDHTKKADPAKLGAEKARLEASAREPADFTASPDPESEHRPGAATREGIATLKAFVREVPEFKIDPTFTAFDQDGHIGLRFKDGGTYSFYSPEALGIHVEGELKPGQRVRIDLDAFKAHKSADGPLVARPDGEPTGPAADVSSAGDGSAAAHPVTHPPPRPLPLGISDGGPHFARELMEASRRLEATARFKSMRSRLGQFVQTTGARDRIEVANVHGTATVSHELGHAVDATMFPKAIVQRAFNLAQRVGGSLRDLTKELTDVSELMRGPITGGPSHIAYRKSSVELFADWFSLYAHDPAAARRLSPKFTAAFEAKLAGFPDVKDIIEGLHRGDVTPSISSAKGGGRINNPVSPPGRVPARPLPPPATRELAARQAVRELVPEVNRTATAQTARADLEVSRWSKGLTGSQLEDVGAMAEGIGNVRIQDDTGAAVRSRATPEMLRALKDFRFQQEAARQAVDLYLRDAGEREYIKYVEDYLTHFYVSDPAQIRTAAAKFAKDSPSARKRKLPTLKEATDLGLVPVTQNAATLQRLWNQINWRVAANRMFLHKLKEITTSSGEPVIQPASQAPETWIPNNHPAIARTYAFQTDSGTTMLWRGGARIHPDIAPAVSMILESPFVPSRWTRGYDAINNWTKATKFLGSFFHDVTLRFSAQGASASLRQPFAGLLRLGEKDPATGQPRIVQGAGAYGGKLRQLPELVEDALSHGLTYHPPATDQVFEPRLRGIDNLAAKFQGKGGVFKWTAGLLERANDLAEKRHEMLWGTQANLKFAAYHDIVSRELQRSPGVDPDAIKKTVAARVNDMFGGQEWESQFWATPNMRRGMRRVLLAPDWTVSTIKSLPGLGALVSRAGGEPFNLRSELIRGRYWAVKLASVAAATIGAQWAIYQAAGDPAKGDHPWLWQNEGSDKFAIDVSPIMRALPWHDPKDQTRHYVNLGKQAGEVLRWFMNPVAELHNKLSPVASEAWTQLTGDEGNDFDAPFRKQAFWESLPGRLGHASEIVTPFSFHSNQFALAFPMRKGTTEPKAEKAIASALELYADPSLFRSITREGPAGVAHYANTPDFTSNLPGLVHEVMDAARANGVQAERTFRNALGKVRGEFYGQFLRAIKNKDAAAANRAARAIIRLNATASGIRESAKARGYEPDAEEMEAMQGSLGRAAAVYTGSSTTPSSAKSK